MTASKRQICLLIVESHLLTVIARERHDHFVFADGLRMMLAYFIVLNLLSSKYDSLGINAWLVIQILITMFSRTFALFGVLLLGRLFANLLWPALTLSLILLFWERHVLTLDASVVVVQHLDDVAVIFVIVCMQSTVSYNCLDATLLRPGRQLGLTDWRIGATVIVVIAYLKRTILEQVRSLAHLFRVIAAVSLVPVERIVAFIDSCGLSHGLNHSKECKVAVELIVFARVIELGLVLSKRAAHIPQFLILVIVLPKASKLLLTYVDLMQLVFVLNILIWKIKVKLLLNLARLILAIELLLLAVAICFLLQIRVQIIQLLVDHIELLHPQLLHLLPLLKLLEAPPHVL